MMNFETLNPLSLLTVGSVVAALWTFLDKIFERIVLPAATAEATSFGHFAESFIDSELPPDFRPLVETELAALASKAGSDALTVKGAAAAILAKIAPQVPAATITDVLDVIAESTSAFVSALAPASAPSAPTLEPVKEFEPVKESNGKDFGGKF